ncbi:rod shape-determining protein RodA [candidate division WWE3 bacterium CG10_big_fil_rev_8_21_14_0_10_32_10]|uniref:Rod shape-determining protein RodA n=1 Tax=candidate division WWE3 bacterium CG10_big_fil_rev_8_21_14_0_10_32_10 TaxID=1975090 RepID=A0A2H0RAX9_UNCKA|nr:MAG: rod shape-determining protein RodA [candidate division WWE3 bacterium CG10_big_fil_rev_8_21_14_0_10_32_10]
MFKKRDFVLDIYLIFIVCFGLFSLLSISDYYLKQQLVFVIFGFILYFLIPFFKKDTYKMFFPVFYIFIFLALLYLLFFGHSIRGSSSWIDLGPFNFQPSEITKFIVIFICSDVLSRQITVLKKVLLMLIYIFPLIALTFLEPDLGTTIVLVFIVGVLNFISLMTPRTFIIGLFAVLLVSGIGYNFLHSYQKARIDTFLNPGHDPLGSGYNVIQSKIAIGSGGLFGKGFKKNTQVTLNFLPEPHTDFIFAASSEAFGFSYSISILLTLFSFIFWVIYKYIYKVEDPFKVFFAYGTLATFFFQIFLNIGMNLGLLPVTGLTLPLISYGGSSLLAFFTMFGFLQMFNFDS